MTMTIPLRVSLEDIEVIRHCVRKSRAVEPPQDLQEPIRILSRILDTAYREVNDQQNTLEAFSQALENHGGTDNG